MIPSTQPLAWDKAKAEHLLRRTSFAATGEDVRSLLESGPHKAVDRILAPANISLPELPEFWEAEKLQSMRMGMRRNADPEMMKEVRDLAREMTQSLRKWWLDRMLLSRPSVLENLTLFWHGHFATSIQKVRSPLLMHRQNLVLRDHALGPMPELAKAVTGDPALMIYLDLQQSKASAPNENFARELFELFLLGEGHYGEADISEAARACTGYSYLPKTGEVLRRPRLADTSEKTIFGKTGRWDCADVVDLAFEQPACAPFLAKRLWTYFAGSEPDPQLADKLAERLRVLKFHTGDWLREVFLMREFYSPAVVARQIKSPVQWLVGTCAALSVPMPQNKQSERLLQWQGQVLFAPPNVRGWEGGRAWINNATLAVRYEGAKTLMKSARANGNVASTWIEGVPDTSVSALEELSRRLLAIPLPPEKQQEILASISNPKDPLTNRKKYELTTAILSTPEYQIL